MPRYLSQHTIACLTRQGAEELTARLQRRNAVHARRVLLSMHDGKLLVEFDASSREELEKWLAAEKFHFDWLLRIEYESHEGSARFRVLARGASDGVNLVRPRGESVAKAHPRPLRCESARKYLQIPESQATTSRL